MAYFQSTLPQMDGVSGNTQSAAMKLNELFFFWMTLPETKDFIEQAVTDAFREAHINPSNSPVRPLDLPTDHHTTACASPPMSPARVRSSSGGSTSPQPSLRLSADELDMAHRHGALSPRASSPSSPTSGTVNPPVHHIMRPSGVNTSGRSSSPVNMSLPVPSDVQIPSQPVSMPSPPSPKAHSQKKKNSVDEKVGKSLKTRRVATLDEIPTFYFGVNEGSKETPKKDVAAGIQAAFQKVGGVAAPSSATKKKSLFSKSTPTKGGAQAGAKVVRSNQFAEISGVLDLPKWMGSIVFAKVHAWEQRRSNTPPTTGSASTLSPDAVRQYYESELQGHSRNHNLFNVIRQDSTRPYLVPGDFFPIVKELLRVHPGLDFLKQTPEFMDKYAETVVIRIFYGLDATGTRNRITFAQFDRSNLPDTMRLLDEEEDINAVRDYFSYEHFYVLYCKFWELDTDRDYLIGRPEFGRYGAGCLSARILDRIVAGHARRLTSGRPGKLNYEDFVWFCLSEEDKTSVQSLQYWFRAMDLDGDGIISGYELDVFLQEQKNRMQQLSIEAIAVEDIMCQMIDMLKPLDPNRITLRDFKSCPTSGVFINSLLNLNKFLIFEQRDPFAAHAEKQLPEKTDWDRFARMEYDRMAMEAEGGEEDDGFSWN
eukprot:PhM_4_TR7208/c0_g1_i1/m.30713/K11583/PPP2R3; serine/threonine-protein phosphatase 2A regulatory subunit B''